MTSIASIAPSQMRGLSATEMKQHRLEMFTRMDTNGDGSVDKAEFTAFGQQMAERMGGSDRSAQMFAAMDTDGDGLISQAEAEAFEPPPPLMQGAEMFAKMDANGDGSVDKAEFTAFGQQMSATRPASDRSEEIFSKMDTNQDGYISQAEFEAAKPPAPPSETASPSTTLEETSRDTLAALLKALQESDEQETWSTLRSAIQQFDGSLGADTESAINVLA